MRRPPTTFSGVISPVTEPSHAVFLSYASQDVGAAKRICDALRAAGIEVWFDQSELRGGEAWDRQITGQIRECALFLAVISAHTEQRSEGYFRREWRVAVERMRDMADDQAFLLPVVIDSTREDAARVPDRFREFQWLRLSAGETPPAAVERIQRLLSPAGPMAATPEIVAPTGGRPAPVAQNRARLPWLKPSLLATGLLVLGASLYLTIDRLVLLRRTPPASVAARDKSIAVLPFIDMSEKRDQEFFADGMAEEIINLLVKVPNLKVIGRTSSFQFKGKAEDLRQIGGTLGAAYLVEGSVRRSGSHVRVSAQLIDTHDGTHRWSDTYDREARDVLAVQEEIAAALVRALQLEVVGLPGVESRAQPKNAEAYDAYLHGLHAFNRFNQPGFDEAVADFKRALDIDPTFVPAAEQLARAYCDEPSWGFVPPAVGFEQARDAAMSTLKLDPQSAVGHTVLACVHLWYDWDWSAASKETTTAMTLAPRDGFTLVTACDERIALGQWTEAIRLADAALSVDPLLASAYENLNWAYLRSGRFAEAEAAARRILQISPTYGGGHRDLGNALLMQGKAEEALAEMRDETFVGWQMVGLVLANQALRRAREADAALARLEAEHSTDMAMGVAEAYAFNGHRDQAFAWLERAYAQKDIFLWAIKGDPFLKTLEGDPRYQAFLRKMNLPD